MGTRTAIYARISSDREGREYGVTRQLEDTRAFAEARGLDVVRVFSENDTGASTRSRKARPKYREMLRMAEAGEIDAVLAWSTSRLTRRPRELMDVIDLAQDRGLRVFTCKNDDLNLNTSQGRAVALTLIAWDAQEAEETGDRARRAFEQYAAQGKRHGQVPLGWRLDEEGRQVVDDDAAGMIREAARRVLARESLRSVVTDFNARGLHPKRAGQWSTQQLRRVLLREANAGRRLHHGKVTAEEATWPPLWDAETHECVVALLTDPRRKTTRGTALKHLLTGIVKCGREGCDGVVRVNTGGTSGRAPAYTCGKCLRVRRKVSTLDDFVTTALLKRLRGGDNLASGDVDARRDAEDTLDGLRARLDRAAARYAADEIDDDQLAIITATLRRKIEAARLAMRDALPAPEFARFEGVDAVAAWEDASLDERRAVIRYYMPGVILLPSGPGVPFSDSQVQIEWR